MLIHLTSPLIRIKGICKGVTSLTYYLMRIKCGVKAVITFDHTFDTNQRKSKSIFSCSVIYFGGPARLVLLAIWVFLFNSIFSNNEFKLLFFLFIVRTVSLILMCVTQL